MTTTPRPLPSPEEQKRVLDNCDFNIEMFDEFSVSAAESHRARSKVMADEQRAIKAELVAYFAGEKAYKELTWPAQEKMYVYPDWATKGT